jgi:hypothetical protein
MSVGGSAFTDNYGIIAIPGSTASDCPAVVYSANKGYFGGVLPDNTGTGVTLDDAIQITPNSMLKGNGGTSTVEVLSAAYYNSPYTAAQMIGVSGTSQASCQARTISTAVKIYCDTPGNYKGGSMFMYVDETHGNLNSISPQALANEETCRLIELDRMGTNSRGGSRGAESSFMFSTSDTETSYPSGDCSTALYQSQSVYGLSGGVPLVSGTTPGVAGSQSGDNSFTFNVEVGAAPMMIVLMPSLSTTVAATFRVEVISHVEYVGSATQSAHTMSHTDPVAFAAIHGAAQRLHMEQMAKPNEPVPALFDRLISGVAAGFSTVERNRASLSYLAGIGGNVARALTNG